MKVEAYILTFMLVVPVGLSAQQTEMLPELAELDATMTAAAQAGDTNAPDALTAAATLESALPAPEPYIEEPPAPATEEPTPPTEESTRVPIVAPPDPTVLEAGITGETSEFTPLPVAPALPEEMTGESTGEDLITISLDDVELIDVVRMFSRIANANIIATPSNLTARVTANLDNVAWRPALSQILAQHNLSLIERPQGSGVYSITTQSPDAPEPMIVETIFLDYTTVDEVSPVIERILAGQGSISTFPSRNAMVIRSTESKLSEIRFVIKDIDIQSQQVCIETQFMELSDSASKQLGIRWDSLESLGVGLQAGPFERREERTRTTERADGMNRSDSQSSGDGLFTQYDGFGNQYGNTDPTLMGDATPLTDFNGRDYYSTRDITRAVDLTQEVTSDISDTFTRAITESSAAILSEVNLNVVLSALKKTDGVSIISNPKLIVANGATNAVFRVGESEPILKTTTIDGTTDNPGRSQTTELDTSITTDYIKQGYLHTGIELAVIPTVKTDNLIEAQIEPSLRRKLDDKWESGVPGVGNSWPIISVKEIKTKFTLSSGQTVAIGGLTDSRDSKATSKIPLLGDIPILGKYLFSHTKDVKTQVETIIFVRLTLVDPKFLRNDEGIPQRAELVHKAQIKAEIRERETKDEIRRLRQAADELDKRRSVGKQGPK